MHHLKPAPFQTVMNVQEAVRQSRKGPIWQLDCCLRGLKAWSSPLGSTISGHPLIERGLSRGDHSNIQHQAAVHSCHSHIKNVKALTG